MTVLVLYAANRCLSNFHQPVKTGKSVIWVRVQEFENSTLDEALNEAKPFPGEVVLNSIYKKVKKC